MKRFLLMTASAAALGGFLMLPNVAAAGISGTLTLDGYVTSKCVVGAGPGTTFADTIHLGELDGSDGKISSTLTGYTAATTPQTATVSITCNTGAPTVTVTNSELIDSALGTPPSGYSNAINYSAEADVVENASTEIFGPIASTGATAGSTGPTAVASPIKNQASNVTLKAYAFHTSVPGNTTNDDTLILMSSNGVAAYSGVITLTISPS